MAASKLKRVSAPTEECITTLATREGRTFVAQLDRVVHAGLEALGEPLPDTPSDTPTAEIAPSGKGR
jgi:hypothetical protein